MFSSREHLFISEEYEIKQNPQKQGNSMRIISNIRAVSTFILIILILCSAVLGALISYMLVMSSYYNMPENTTLLIVENVVFPTFPVFDFTHFNVTILNPSNSASDVNIMAIRLSVEGKNEIHDITATEPEPLPFLIRRGTKQTFKCKENWSNFAGETVKIEPVTENASTKSYSYATPKVKLILTPNFNVSESVEYFDLTVQNSAESVINLTISEIEVPGPSINVTPSLPYILSPNQTEIFWCDWNWKNYWGETVTINVTTAEGYESVYITDELLGANLYVDEVKLDYADTTYFNLTIKSSEGSTARAIINRVNLTLSDETTITLNTDPPLHIIPIRVPLNESLTIRCLWDWNTYRNETITVSIYTRQGFTVHNKTVITPLAVVWNITDVKFDLDRTDHFLVNVTNMPCSLQNITITKIEFNENETSFETQVVPIGEESLFNCTFDWKDIIGENVNMIVLTEDGLNISRLITIPSVELKLLGKNFVFGDLYDPHANVTVPYGNITISNSMNSLKNVTVTKIIFETGNRTGEINNALTHPKLAPSGYYLRIGENITIVCLWDYTVLGSTMKVTVYTAEGFQVSRTWYIPKP